MKRKLSLLAAGFLVIRIAGAANVGVGLPGDNVTVNTHVKIGTSTDPGELTLTGPTGAGATLPTLQITGDGGFYFPASTNTTLEPAITNGSGLFYYPAKAALRLGNFGYLFNANVGFGSLAIGNGYPRGNNSFTVGESMANGYWAVAIGYHSSAYGDYSIALGKAATYGEYSLAAGEYASAFGHASQAFGASSSAVGNYAAAFGASSATGNYAAAFNASTATGYMGVSFGGATALAAYSMALGQYNTLEGDPLTWVPADPLFVIGNGTGSATNQRSNALVVLKNGKVNLFGTANPAAPSIVLDPNIPQITINGSPVLTAGYSGNLSMGDSGPTLSSPWKGAQAIGNAGYDKVVLGPLSSTYTGATIGAHNSALNAWTDLNVTGQNLIFRAGGESEKARLTAAGNFGIGTTNPTAKLDTNGRAVIRDNMKIFGSSESWAEGLTVIQASSWGGIRLARNDPASGNYGGNWAIGYTGYTADDFSISTSAGGVQYDGVVHISNATRNVGIGTTTPAARLQVSGDGGVYLEAGASTALAPAVSAGNGLFYYPARKALRLGSFSGLTNANVGTGSLVVGNGIASGAGSFAMSGGTASGAGSFAMGGGEASGNGSVVLGSGTKIASGAQSASLTGYYNNSVGYASAVGGFSTAASGEYSFAYGSGNSTAASAPNSAAFGESNAAIGKSSAVLGRGNTAQAGYSLVIGQYNFPEGDPAGLGSADPLFVVGNGTGPAANQKSNAFVVKRNGDIVISKAQGDISMGEFAP